MPESAMIPTETAPWRVAALYRFVRLVDPRAVQQALDTTGRALGIKGTLLLAAEGINGTIAGTTDAIGAMLAAIAQAIGTVPDVKYAEAHTAPFLRFKVRIKREIVSLGVDGVDPVGQVGTYVAPQDWNALIADPDVVLIDTRNDYEVAIGSFEGATDPHTRRFRDFPAWFESLAADLRARATPPRIAMFCTGGIRCEKATALVRQAGFDDVYHLQGGILRYLEAVPAADSRWQGECFVFDERVAVGHGLAPGTHDLCRGCRMPVGPAEKASPHYVEGVSCPACHAARSDDQRAGYAERARQITNAARKGQRHIGPPD